MTRLKSHPLPRVNALTRLPQTGDPFCADDRLPHRHCRYGQRDHGGQQSATNAAKYGSLSAADGRVEITWSRTADGRLSLRWIESGGPPVTPPTRRGFGRSIMENIIAGQLRGEVRFDWRDRGLACKITLPLA